MNQEASLPAVGDDLAAKRIIVVGQGYVRLPLAVRAVEAGYAVVGYDIDQNRIARLETGDSFIEDVPAVALMAAFDTGRFTVSTKPVERIRPGGHHRSQANGSPKFRRHPSAADQLYEVSLLTQGPPTLWTSPNAEVAR
ncbi:MAG: hypothetical protein ACR2NL_09970 [Acidimicrobiia bacterium]